MTSAARLIESGGARWDPARAAWNPGCRHRPRPARRPDRGRRPVGAVAEAWREWSAGVPEGVATIDRVLRLPPVTTVPESPRGRAFAIVEAVDLDGPGRLDGLLAGLRRPEPGVDTFRPLRSTDLREVHMDPPEPGPAT